MNKRLRSTRLLGFFVPALMILSGCGQSATPAHGLPKVTTLSADRTLNIYSGKEEHKPGWPRYVPAFWSAPAHSTVILTIICHDHGTAPLMMTQDDKVSGTLGNVETIDGTVEQHVPNNQIAHTFTVPALGLNLPIPAAPAGKTITVRAEIPLHNAGSYAWQCMAPCGTGTMGMQGPMVTPGYMQGTLTVTAS